MGDKQLEMATLAGGCFWCIEAIFEQMEGVESVVSGYTGGTVPNPSYEHVCTGTTGHAEAVQVTFDPDVISFRGLLEIFFVLHDPTTLNRQGPDMGTQYRSAVFYHSDRQKALAEEVMKETAKARVWDNPIVTQVQPAGDFYRAEDYHQGYYRKNSDLPYCRVIISPKVAKLRKSYFDKLKKRVSA